MPEKKVKKSLPDIRSIPTEQRNRRSMKLHTLSVPQLVELFIDEERQVQKALVHARPQITKACALVAKAIANGGRLFYVGAGTSGRLGVLDASEMPPTFSVPPDLVQGIIAGGTPAIFRSQEGAEDDFDGGAKELRSRKITKKDVVWGIAASGRTPFVLGALTQAKKIGAKTVFFTCNPKWKHPTLKPTVGIHLATGPELITGSTRLKAGTATKLVLNMASSIAMIRTGKVFENLMIHVAPTNEKLRARAVNLVRQLAKCDADAAIASLEKNQWHVLPAAQSLVRI